MPSFQETSSGVGKVQLILGPMFSGKSTELIRRLKRYQVAKYEVLIIKYAKDVRYDENGISTHDRQTLPAVAATTLKPLTAKATAYDVIGIDEGQFFPDISWVEEMANMGKIVLVAALDGTFQRKPFSNIMDLIPLAEGVTKLSAVCMNCFGDAAFTKRTSQEESLEVIGGADKYMAVCRKCYLSPVQVATSPLVYLNLIVVVGCY
ncbi:thymidine kinase, cytosolic isoform X3 [Eurytemora carolleeae]|uniref:thymidine kinase, cytosolic isoform X3 n=1 Tax=Eurytemora carolleeae TaxID=1294199 RepID=UPI000C788ACD|nr:thymidine kinase, cytosolic isoform X3 [Eurytemora carolleeae]|eukprot:XP_023339762.1 thymidine kinase, cytosolic-like isoform X3 [Eurytemora affinis]